VKCVRQRCQVAPSSTAAIAAFGVDARGDEHTGAPDAAVLADLHRERVHPHERVRLVVQRPVPPRLDHLNQSTSATQIRLTWDLMIDSMPIACAMSSTRRVERL
jgi:hypothetical protein